MLILQSAVKAFSPEAVQKAAEEAANKAALEEAQKPHLSLLGVGGLVAIGVAAAWVVFRAR